MSQAVLDGAELQRLVGARTIGRRIELHDEVVSTNTLALQGASSVERHGQAIFAEYQRGGRGRMNRTWHAPRGASILCSVLLFLDPLQALAQRIMLWSSLAVRDALRDSCAVSACIKWPNDLMVNHKKIAGILIESRPAAGTRRAYVIGVGINCLQHAQHFPPEIRERATSLDLESSQPVCRLAVAAALLQALDERYRTAGSAKNEQLKAEWIRHSLPLGGRLQLRSQGRLFSGSLIELDPECGIVLQLDQGGRQLFSPQTTTIEGQ